MFLLSIPALATAANGPQYLFHKADFPSGSNPTAIAVAEVDGDGRQDLIIANQQEHTISVLLGQADGLYAPKVDYPTGSYPTALVAGDFNLDGKLDIITASACGPNCSSISVLLGI